MAAFKYKGYSSDGQVTVGEIRAESIEEAERRIVQQDVTIISIIPAGMRQREKSTPSPRQAASGFGRRVPDADVAVVLRNLAVMAETGVPFIEALDASIESARTPKIQAALQSVRHDVISGHPLSLAMKSVPLMFPPIICNLIRVAEEAGELQQALHGGADYMERAADLRKRVVQAMLYPAVMLSVAVSTVAVLIVFVLPKFSDIFVKMKADVPASTKMMLALGDFIRGNPILTVGILAGLIIGSRIVFQLPATNRVLMSVFFRIPGLGLLLRDLALSRSLQSISTMLNGNVPVMEALEQGASVANNHQVANALREASRVVEHGGTLAEGLGKTGVLPKMLIQMVAVGERTGRLAHLMVISAHKMDDEANTRLKSMVALLEPAMIVVMGLIVGTITISVISPIYSVVQNIK